MSAKPGNETFLRNFGSDALLFPRSVIWHAVWLRAAPA